MDPGGPIVVHEPSYAELINAAANVVYNSIPWSAARRNRRLLGIKIASFGIKGLTPELRVVDSREQQVELIAELVNEINVIALGVDPEDLLKPVAIRGLIGSLLDFANGNRNGIVVTTRGFFFSDP